MYEINARSTLRAFLRRLETTGRTLTANGKANMYAGRDQFTLRLRAAGSERHIVLKYTQIRAALQLTYYERTVTRKDLEVYTKGANSALLGVLIEIFASQGKITRSKTGLVRLTLRGVRYFVAGCDKSVQDLMVAVAAGAKFILLTYAHIRSQHAWKRHVDQLGLKVLLDSGAFTNWKAKKRGVPCPDILLEDYAKFIFDNRERLYAWFNLDIVGDPISSKRNEEYLRAAGLTPIPVWHAGGSLEVLRQMVNEDHAVIGIGGTVGMSERKRKQVFDEVFQLFPSQNFHFCGGSSRLLTQYEWFSADSIGWLAPRMYGAIITEKGQQKAPVSMSPIEAMFRSCKYLLSLEQVSQ
ncbi:hypothetical protein ACE41H_15695 [Paenibacillus enshidis]|uniref:Uncharacterized protein n=1 Tax=Paenibacillus enshidis TaxID=1458439 RepID=A0ABV5AW08_9BACL